MDGQSVFAERDKIKASLNESLKRAYDSGIKYAEKNRAYRIALAQQISIIEKVARGDEDVAQAEFDMISAEVSYRASNENIMAKKKELESVEADIKREFYSG